MMKKSVACLWLLCVLLLNGPAHSTDDITQAYDLSLMTTRMVLAYDACVKDGLIHDDKPSAEERYQRAIIMSRSDNASDGPQGVTREHIADALQKAFDAGRAAVAAQPLQIDSKKCDSVKAHWPKFAQQSGLDGSP
jgi:hypothetical protein